MLWSRLLRAIKILLFFSLMLLLLTPQWPEFGDPAYRLTAIVGLRHFDFAGWELNAIGAKVQAAVTGSQNLLDAAAQKEAVLAYMETLRQAQQLDAQMTRLYVDPTATDVDTAVRPLQAQYAALRESLAAQQPVVEAIVQAQVGTILVEEGFGVAGYAWPPVLMHMTPLPTVLMVSPRDRIEREYSLTLMTGMTTPQQDAIETAVYDDLDRSALVVPIGGMGTIPAMIQETSWLNWLAEVTAHEWSHHWMGFHPVGWNYTTDPQVRVINETVASIIDREIGEQVIGRYYPELVPPDTAPAPPASAPGAEAPPPFDFTAEMGETRLAVDALLADGQIDAAEAYMEARRRVFVENGYAIRKLNQAYFAFYGAYAAQPGGATGADPIGPTVREIRRLSPTLRDFMDNMAQVGSFAELMAVLGRLQGG